MKIGLICPYNLFRGGGVQEHVLAQADLLRKKGHEIIIITPKPQGFKDSKPDNMIFIGRSATLRMPISTSLELGGSFERDTIDEILEREQFDLLHLHEPEVPMLGAQIIAKARCPIVATFHASHPKNTAGKTINRLRVPYSKSIFSRLNEITAVSDVAAEFVRAHVDKKQHEVKIISNGILLSKYEPGKHNNKHTILYVGRLEKRKGINYLLDAFAITAKNIKNAQLIIAGDGPDREKLEEQAYELGISSQVSFLGYISENKKLSLLKSSALFCSPAIYGESFGIVLLEAMASGLPIVAADNPGYRTVLKDRGLLSLVDVKSTEDFARRIQLLLTDSVLRSAWQEWAQDYVKQFDYPKIISEYEKIYKQVLKG